MSYKDIPGKCSETCHNGSHAINRHYCPECGAGVHLICAEDWGIEFSGENDPLCLACYSNGPPRKPASKGTERTRNWDMSEDEDDGNLDLSTLSHEKAKDYDTVKHFFLAEFIMTLLIFLTRHTTMTTMMILFTDPFIKRT
jgi:hypothetical protein